MGSDDTMTGGNEEFVRQLRRLEPAGHAIDRDALMFRAGQRSAGRRLRLWQSLTGTMVLVAAGLGLLSPVHYPPGSGRARLLPSRLPLGLDPARQEPRPTGFMATAPGPTHRQPAGRLAGQDQPPDGGYLELRRRVTLDGLDALPLPGWAPPPPAAVQTIADWLRLPDGSISPSDPLELSGTVTKGNPS